MNEENFNDMPEWDDGLNEEEDQGEGWKPNPTRDTGKELYSQWASIITMLREG